MGRRPDGSTARSEVIHIRIGESGLKALDQARGAWTRSEYIRRAIEHHVNNEYRGPARGPDPDWE